ncbi:Putative receptor-like protein kinase [Striga hermonthica]|uniref:non-specific serine/threonine protein kinase n=1 Tax=Striga hermonthica TaxID=68872 RepID=A0A9N7NB49_STRHE|nr:Putative receptor-like protein kinase [Striga hermonthica]
MSSYRVSIAMLFLCLLKASTADSSDPTHSTAEFSVNCGSLGTFAARNGREWIGDVMKPKPTSLVQIQGSSTTSTVNTKLITADPIPHKTARISHSRFSYIFHVKPGQKIIRLHFNPSPYKGFKGFKDLFTVEAGPFTLLDNFSAALTADALGMSSFSKEFCLNVQENEQLRITFSPENIESLDTYAFINGIEIISVPASVSYFGGGGYVIQEVGQNSLIGVDQHTALEIVHQQKIKYSAVQPSGDFDETFPIWRFPEADKAKATWRIPVDVGFRYMIRLHFSEMGLRFIVAGDVMFEVLINEMVALTNIDMVEEMDENYMSLYYKDCLIMVRGNKNEGRRDLSISLNSHDDLIDGHGLLVGFEIFKLSNPDYSLGSPNPLPPANGSSSKTIRNLFLALCHRNLISTAAISMISLACIIVHKSWEYLEANYTKEENKPSDRAERLCRRFSLTELQLATRNFSDALLIGRGGFGKVYKGLIDRGQTTVAVKRLKSNSMQGAREFLMEIETLSELRHVNLVSLIGYCNEHGEMILVYDYMAGGTLADHLDKLKTTSTDCISLNWKQCLNICVGAGRGLDYLHTGHGVIHCDVKSSNILLDENFAAKVSDFGLAKHEDKSKLQSHVSTRVKGTNGYLDPHYLHTRKLTRKTDMYAFGVVMFEILCGRLAVDLSLVEDEHILTIWARDKISKGEIDQILAPSLREEISPASLETFVGIAERCLRDDPKSRPTMSQVVLQLELALEQQDHKQPLVLNETKSASDDTSPGKDGICASGYTEKPTMASINMQNLAPLVEEQTSSQVANAGSRSVRKYQREDMTRRPRLWPWDAFWNRGKPSKKNDSLSEIWEESNIRCTKYDWDTIAAATLQFSTYNSIGRDAFGSDYKGVLPTGQEIAVKRLSPSLGRGPIEFKNEIRLLSNLQHRNIIKLLGYCMHMEEKLLVYEFVSNTSLDAFIGDREHRHLYWEERFKIIVGIARGLVYLHQDSGLRVIHRDLKLRNILLDAEMNPKICGFAIARTLAENHSELEAHVAGTIGYIPPECLQHGKVSVKFDVYSFGVLILEIVSGRGRMNASYSEPMPFYDYARKLWDEGKACDLVDESLEGAFLEEEAMRCIQVGLLCTQTEPNLRPQMANVLKMLEGNELLLDPRDPQPQAFHGPLNLEDNIEGICDSIPNLTKFDWHTVATATNQFSVSNKVGEATFGPLYKAVLPSGQLVTVKRLTQPFKKEILLLPRIQHRNVIKLLGYCILGEDKLLVYDGVAESISTIIFGDDHGRQSLPWPLRFKIIIRIARAVVDLHDEFAFSVVSRDLTSKNILLDSYMNPILSNFYRFAQSEMRSSRPIGTFVYNSPEYDMRRDFSVESVMYNFGIIVMEIVSGRRICTQDFGSTFSLDYVSVN